MSPAAVNLFIVELIPVLADKEEVHRLSDDQHEHSRIMHSPHTGKNIK